MPTGASGLVVFTLDTFTEVSEQDTLTASLCTHTHTFTFPSTHVLLPVCRAVGGPGEEEKEGSVMVEFDDGDRGRISLANIRLLPPGYQIRCEFSFKQDRNTD